MFVVHQCKNGTPRVAQYTTYRIKCSHNAWGSIQIYLRTEVISQSNCITNIPIILQNIQQCNVLKCSGMHACK